MSKIPPWGFSTVFLQSAACTPCAPAEANSARHFFDTLKARFLSRKRAFCHRVWTALFVGDGVHLHKQVFQGGGRGAAAGKHGHLPQGHVLHHSIHDFGSLQNWTVEEYEALFAEIAAGNVEISDELVTTPESTENVTINYIQ